MQAHQAAATATVVRRDAVQGFYGGGHGHFRRTTGRDHRGRTRAGDRGRRAGHGGRTRSAGAVDRGGSAAHVRLVLRGRGRTDQRGPRSCQHAARPVLRARLQALRAPVHDGRADGLPRRQPADERAVLVRGRRVRAGLDAAAGRRGPGAQVPVPDRADRLLHAAVADRGGPPDDRVPRVDRPVRPVLLVDEPPPANDQVRRHRVPVAEAHVSAGDQPAQASDHHHSYITT